ncbi:MAG: hypothetical protein JSW21_03685 [Gammaproteobacteria bacterium]|nr:MAG: hypothetical protein JSW21_03685 [Gammaproteobacteria bacterium]
MVPLDNETHRTDKWVDEESFRVDSNGPSGAGQVTGMGAEKDAEGVVGVAPGFRQPRIVFFQESRITKLGPDLSFGWVPDDVPAVQEPVVVQQRGVSAPQLFN